MTGLPNIEIPAGVPLVEGDAEPTTGGIEPSSASGLFIRIRRALGRVDQTAAGATTHGPDNGKARRRQRVQEHACANLALDALSDLPTSWAISVIRAYLRTRNDIEPGALHDLANQLSRYADDIEREL